MFHYEPCWAQQRYLERGRLILLINLFMYSLIGIINLYISFIGDPTRDYSLSSKYSFIV